MGVNVLFVYMNDIIVTCNDEEGQKLLSIHLVKEFEIKTLGKLKYFLRIEVAYYKKRVFISQQKYITDILQETGKTTCKLAKILVDPCVKLESAEDIAVDKKMYQRLVEKLIYLSHIRLHVSFVISLISQFIHRP
ncbi:uncharacterized mitochondrial protein AtMg00810-like [Lathyrus oleraceus]|uniref:uncharacterized mitochondrial protein AtMg00810-like n=1 Tax=Pisum sativum TaxID=3888 RepID=UPI0021D15F22|nr:uncharacterized mitochondrial protein AtMg00810-like [Pisum sativum]